MFLKGFPLSDSGVPHPPLHAGIVIYKVLVYLWLKVVMKTLYKISVFLAFNSDRKNFD